MIVLLSTYVASGHTLLDADAAAQKAGACLVIDVNYTLTANTTLNAPYVEVAGGIITRGTCLLQLNGIFIGNDYQQLTEAAGTGSVWFARQKRISVRWLGAVVNGMVDDTQAFQATINAAGANGVVYLTAGVLRVSAGVTVSSLGVQIVGDGTRATMIRVYPTAPMAVITFNMGTKISYRCAVRGVWIYSSDATYQKIGLDLYECSEFQIDDVNIGGSVAHNGTGYFSNDSGQGGTSVGLRMHGREFYGSSRLTIFADMPIQICKNPNTAVGGTEDFDASVLRDLYLGANGNPHITIDPDAGLSSSAFEGRQNWVLGTYGIYCKSTGPAMWFGVALRNVRTEQGTDKTAWSCYLDCGSGGIANITFDNCIFDSARQGVYLRGVHRTLFTSCMFEMLDMTALDTVGTASDTLTAISCRADVSAAVNAASMVRIGSIDYGTANPLANNAEYVYWNGEMNAYPSRHMAQNAYQFAWTGQIANGATISLPIAVGYGLKLGRGFVHASCPGIEAYSDFYISAMALTPVNPSANFATTPTASTLTLSYNSGFPSLINYLGAAIDVNIYVDWRD